MASSINKVTLLGNLVRDPEVRQSGDNQKIVTFSVATSEYWRDKNTGERKERAEFHRVVVFNERLADVAEQYLRKGKKVFIEGQLQTRKWTDQSGQDRYTTEVVLGRFRGEMILLDRGGDGEAGGSSFANSENRPSSGAKVSEERASLDDDLSSFDDDIPF